MLQEAGNGSPRAWQFFTSGAFLRRKTFFILPLARVAKIVYTIGVFERLGSREGANQKPKETEKRK